MDRKRVVPITLIVIGVLITIGVVYGFSRNSERTEADEPEPARAQVEAVNAVTAAGLFTFPGDWNDIDATNLTLWTPGITSWQWVNGPEHSGAKAVSEGEGCISCHADQETNFSASTIDLEVKSAYDDEFLYLNLMWQATNPGSYDGFYRYNGENWVSFGTAKEDAEPEQLLSTENRISFMLDQQNNVPAYAGADFGFSEMGCFIACHDDLESMPNAPTAAQVRDEDYWEDHDLDSVTKYLLISRDIDDDDDNDNDPKWKEIIDDDEIEELMAQGMFLDLWDWRAAHTNPVGFAADEFILEYRNEDQGKQVWTPQTTDLKWMYDPDLLGAGAIRIEDIAKNINDLHLVKDKNAVAFIAEENFATGDLIPAILLDEPSESAADIMANGSYSDGIWTVEIRRKLDTGHADDHKLVAGTIYDIAFAIHDDNIVNRNHHVSWSYTLGLGVDADIQAIDLEPEPQPTPVPTVPTPAPRQPQASSPQQPAPQPQPEPQPETQKPIEEQAPAQPEPEPDLEQDPDVDQESPEDQPPAVTEPEEQANNNIEQEPGISEQPPVLQPEEPQQEPPIETPVEPSPEIPEEQPVEPPLDSSEEPAEDLLGDS